MHPFRPSVGSWMKPNGSRSSFPAVYLRFHRRDPKHSEMTGATRGTLLHLSQSGPLTIGEIAEHFERAQSVVSEIVDGLEKKGLLERVRDPKDKRRTLVWLTDAGIEAMERDREVLSRELLERAFAKMSSADRRGLIHGMEALIRTTTTEEKKR